VAGDAAAAAEVENILEEIAQLNLVIERLLFLARTESGALAPALRPVALAPLLASLAEDAQALAEDRGVRFTLGENPAGEIAAEPELLRQLLLNLVTNAVAVSPRGAVVRLDSAPAGEAWQLTVTDEGPGLPADQLGRIFERFVRCPGQMEPAAPAGHGLGLAICKAIAELHGGTIRAENRADRSGLRVTVLLPRQSARA
jgi:signal transduction histidine kinase